MDRSRSMLSMATQHTTLMNIWNGLKRLSANEKKSVRAREDQRSNPPIVSVALLADHPQLISTVGEIRWKEWGHPPEPENLDWWVDVTGREAGRDQLPVTWVAIDHLGDAVGAVGLGKFD